MWNYIKKKTNKTNTQQNPKASIHYLDIKKQLVAFLNKLKGCSMSRKLQRPDLTLVTSISQLPTHITVLYKIVKEAYSENIIFFVTKEHDKL